jgi:O-antigen/teichoic acid export membrane protein
MPTQNATTLKSRATRAGFWVLASHGSSQIIRLLSSLIMTRLLVPESYGLMAIVTVAITGMTLFTDIGISQQLVQSKNGDEPALVNTAWTLQVIRGIIISCLCLLISAVLHIGGIFNVLPVGTVYADPQLKLVLAAMACYPIITSFESTKSIAALRNLDQFRLAVMEVTSMSFSVIGSIGWAFVDRTVWALVFGAMLGGTIKTLMSHTYLPGALNRFLICKTAIRELYSFGIWVFLSTIVTFFVTNGDRILLSSSMEPAEFGVYVIGYNIFIAFRTIVTTVFAKVGYPVISEKVRNALSDAPTLFYRLRLNADIAVLAICGFLVTAGPDIIGLLYDSRYSRAGEYLSILGISLIADRYALSELYLLSLGLPKYLFQFNAIRLVSLYAMVPSAYYFLGTTTAVWAIALSSFIPIPYILYISNRHGIFRFHKEFIALPSLALGALAGLSLQPSWHYLQRVLFQAIT